MTHWVTDSFKTSRLKRAKTYHDRGNDESDQVKLRSGDGLLSKRIAKVRVTTEEHLLCVVQEVGQ